MKNFFYLEGAYLIIGLIIILVTIFVSTRPFMPKGSLKKGLMGVGLFLSLMIGLHYSLTTSRMSEVKTAFNEGKKIICESRMQRKVSPTVIISKAQGWELDGDNFVSPEYVRPFFAARCIVE